MKGRRPSRGQQKSSRSPKMGGRGAGRGGGAPTRTSRVPSARTPSARTPSGGEIDRGRDRARWVVGLHSCEETLRIRPKAIREIWLREDWEASQSLRQIAENAEASRIPVRPKSAGQLENIGTGHQGVALAAMESPVLDWTIFEQPGQHIVLALDGIEDPHNLGAILRTGWLAGVSGILIPEDRAVGLTPATCKVASGGAEHVPVESHPNLPSVLQKLKDLGFWIYGLSEKGQRKPWEFQLPEKVAWVIGSEGSGLRITTERACDELVRIPQVKSGSSYNAAIATAMALGETCRQFGKPE